MRSALFSLRCSHQQRQRCLTSQRLALDAFESRLCSLLLSLPHLPIVIVIIDTATATAAPPVSASPSFAPCRTSSLCAIPNSIITLPS